MRWRILAAGWVLATAGCFSGEDPDAARRIEPTRYDLRILRAEGLAPYSKAGQRRLRKLASDREKLAQMRARRAAQAESRSR